MEGSSLAVVMAVVLAWSRWLCVLREGARVTGGAKIFLV